MHASTGQQCFSKRHVHRLILIFPHDKTCMLYFVVLLRIMSLIDRSFSFW